MRRLGLAAALASSLALVVSTATFAQGLVEVSATPSPYADCGVNGPGRNLYINGEVEPQLAVDPTDRRHLVGDWQQDRWSNGGSHGLVAGFSFDGGQTWGQAPLPFSVCAAPFFPAGGVANFERASDPWVSIGPDGTVYANAISFNRTNNDNGVFSVVSTDGGRSWHDLRTIVQFIGNGGQFSTDKNSITADPVIAGTAYQVWDTLTSPTDQPDDNPHAAAFTGPAFFSKTTDGGSHWSAPTIIVNTGERQQTIGNVIVVDPRINSQGFTTLYDFTDLILPPNPNPAFQVSSTNVAFVKSTDGGRTWSAPHVIGPLQSVGVVDPNTGQRIRTGDIIPEAAIDPATGQLYAVWQRASTFKRNPSPPFDDQVVISTSTNGGTNWSAPTVVHQLPSGLPTFTPTVAINSAGTVGVSYYDFRNLAAGNTTRLPTDYWINFSTDHGASFPAANEQHVAGTFDMLTAPFARGFFVGDYEGLQAVGSTFQAFFVQTNCQLNASGTPATPGDPACAPANSATSTTPTSNTNPTDVFTGNFSLAPTKH
jgi:hypothetical protein